MLLINGGIVRRRSWILQSDVDEQVDKSSDDVAVIALPVDPEVTREELLQAVPGVEAVRLHHLRHRGSEIEERIVGIHRHDFGALAVGERVGFAGFFEDGARLTGIEEEAIGPQPSDHCGLVVDSGRGGEALLASATAVVVVFERVGEFWGGFVVEIGGVHRFVDVGVGVGAEREGFRAVDAGRPRPWRRGGGGGGGGGIVGFEKKWEFHFLTHLIGNEWEELRVWC